MCFSASASFTAGAFLVPMGLYCLYSAHELKRYHYLLLACVPLFFGIQQITEGGVWLSLGAQSEHYIRLCSLGFVFFSHLFWPIWVPLSAYFVARHRQCTRAWIILFITFVGTVIGLLGYIPYLLHDQMIQTKMHANSIQYSLTTIYDALLGTSIPKYMYIGIIILPLWISRDSAMKALGMLIFLSVVTTYAFYSYAFNSVWCFFSAIISMYIVYIIRRKKDHGLAYVVEPVGQ